jgi:hypothetical protein
VASSLLALGVVACGGERQRADVAAAPLAWVDTAYASAAIVTAALRDAASPGALQDRALREASGVVRSLQHPGVLWSFNDSGGQPSLFALDTTGVARGVVQVSGARNRDWEAAAAGPCPDGVCLYIGDLGDNLSRHPSVTVWRIPEPAPPGAGAVASSEPATALHLRYDGGPRDVEAMWVDADTVLWLATKRPLRGAAGERRPSLLYRVRPDAWGGRDTVLAELVDSLPNVPRRSDATLITDAALSHPLGADSTEARLAVRSLHVLWVFAVGARSGRPLTLEARCDLRPLGEVQGEGVTWLPDGRVLLTSEQRGAPLHTGRCP